LHAPLVLPDAGGVAVQVAVDGPDDEGRRAVTLHSTTDAAEPEAPWVRHATGWLVEPSKEPPALDDTAWPPTGATPLELTGCYDGLAERGLSYGPAFRGLRAAWRRGDELFAEVTIPDLRHDDQGLHPALLDSALHAQLVAEEGDAVVPFAWSGVEVFASGASLLRVRMAPADGDGVSLTAVDQQGQMVVAADSLVTRPLGELGEGAAPGAGELFGVEWAEW
ncbi:polyketide synthase dehydratase domain-containing protein, partial [Streptomyces sp. M2CJ-2]|uniref:polyketide synthase dehydratase domain-containing protein n=1 Tax=Streptomyces sp. M2CJ-2 TaxID=2803948 RepID=UPI001925BC97